MNFNKIGLVALSAGAIFMATSCNKVQTLKYDDAFYWVQKNYKKTGRPETISGENIVADFSATKGSITFKDSIRSAVESSVSLFAHPISLTLETDDNHNLKKTTKELTEEEIKQQTEEAYQTLPFVYLNEITFETIFNKDNTEFTVSNNSLAATETIALVPDDPIMPGTGKIIIVYNFDSVGALKSYITKMENVTFTNMIGTANGYATISFTY